MTDNIPNTTIYHTLSEWKRTGVPFGWWEADAQNWLNDLINKNLESKGMWKFRHSVCEIWFNKRKLKFFIDFSGAKGFKGETSAKSVEEIITALEALHYKKIN